MQLNNIKKNHKTVLLEEVIDIMNPQAEGTYIDSTFGSGGHALGILTKSPNANVIAFDRDKSVIEYAKKLQEQYGKRFRFINDNFSNIGKYINKPVNGIYADLGMSNMQLQSNRGFAFSSNSILDMRMGDDCKIDAKVLLNTYSYEELKRIFKSNADDYIYSKRLSRKIISSRSKNAFHSTSDFTELLKSINDHPRYIAKIFQAIRIEVNEEKENLKRFLVNGINILYKDSPIAIISFHSGENNIIRDFFYKNSCPPVSRYDDPDMVNNRVLYMKKPRVIKPSHDEVIKNSMARSAIMRIAYKS